MQLQSAPLQPTNSKRGLDVDFVLPAHQVAVFEVVTRSNHIVVPVPQLATYVVNGADEPYTGKFLWADDPEDLDSLTGVPRWRFGIIGPDGSNLPQGLGVPTAPADYSGGTDLWIALQSDAERCGSIYRALGKSRHPVPRTGCDPPALPLTRQCDIQVRPAVWAINPPTPSPAVPSRSPNRRPKPWKHVDVSRMAHQPTVVHAHSNRRDAANKP